ncbi:zinc-binding dehydrogenase [Streptomyces sp. NPDC001070]
MRDITAPTLSLSFPRSRGRKALDVWPDAAQLAQLAEAVAEGKLKQNVEVLPLSEGPDAFARVSSGQAGGKKTVLT